MKVKRIAEPKPGECNLCCECGHRIPTVLVPGRNELIAICGKCGSFLRVNVDYDGYGSAVIQSGTIEQVEKVSKTIDL